MLTKRLQTSRTSWQSGSASLSAFLAMVIAFLLSVCVMPQHAWGDNGAEIPKGTLTLCDDPFSIDDCDSSAIDAPGSVVISSSPDAPGETAVVLLPDSPAETASPSEAADPSEADAFDNASGEGNAATVDTSDVTQDSTYPDISGEDFEGSGSVEEIASSDASTLVTVSDEDLCAHEQSVVLVQVKGGVSRADIETIALAGGKLDTSQVTDEDLAYGLVKLVITDDSPIASVVACLKQVVGVIDAQPNYVYKVESSGYTVVNDPWASYQWALDSVNAREAWDLARTSGAVSVAVIDTGADLDHPDLVDNIVATYNSLSSTYSVEDQVGHGTHVAGIIAGAANNRVGVAGVSYNAGLVIIKASAFKSVEFDTSAIVRAYAWLESLDSSGMTVAEHYNVRIVNLSIGGLDDTRKANMPDDALNKAMLKARDEYGLLTICAAGNAESSEDAPYATYPGDSDACMSVMNLCNTTDDTNEVNGVSLEETSNYNVSGDRSKDICAPGTSIQSTWINGKYASSKGTSMAAPMVAGVAALLFAANPTLTPLECMSVLEASATDLGDEGWDERYGYGEVNAAAAVRMVNGARVEGWDVVSINDTIPFSAQLGWGMQEDDNGWTWSVWKGDGNATVDSSGSLRGRAEGDVTVVATCTATTGAQISATKTVYVVDAEIVGDETLAVGESSSAYTTDDPRWTWVWKVENGTGEAHIDQDAILHADKPGTVYVTATCSSNTDIVLYHRVTISE